MKPHSTPTRKWR